MGFIREPYPVQKRDVALMFTKEPAHVNSCNSVGFRKTLMNLNSIIIKSIIYFQKTVKTVKLDVQTDWVQHLVQYFKNYSCFMSAQCLSDTAQNFTFNL